MQTLLQEATKTGPVAKCGMRTRAREWEPPCGIFMGYHALPLGGKCHRFSFFSPFLTSSHAMYLWSAFSKRALYFTWRNFL